MEQYERERERRSRKRHDYILLEREREAISAGEGVMGWMASNLIFRLTDKQGAWD